MAPTSDAHQAAFDPAAVNLLVDIFETSANTSVRAETSG
jgi:hypothetical protein